MRRRNWLAILVLLAVFGVLAWRLGAGPFVDGVRELTVPAIVVAVALTALATLASTWRWTVVARVLGAEIPLRRAVPAYYRSQLLNSVLPGGVLGDVERGLTAGEGTRSLGIVAWDRAIGQVAQLAVLVVVALIIAPPVGLGIVIAVAALVVVLAHWSPRGAGRVSRFVRRVREDAGRLIARPGVLARAGAASVVVVLLHASVFVVAALVTGAASDPLRLLPIALAVEAVMAIPLNVAGWGPREGAAAAIFAATGLGAASGLAASVAYGVLALIAVLPGAVVLVVGRRRVARMVHA